MSSIRSVLVANRGEIACRIIRSLRHMGIRSIAVYSDADADAPHTALADEAVNIGPAPAQESYLNSEALLQAALNTRACAVHPGYGFLSENAEFAEACVQNGLIFIGPNTHAIEIMGNKAASKRHMLDADVPCVPGYQGEDQTADTLIKAAQDIGTPLMVKAAAGGGGRGMRLVHNLDELPQALERARSEALNAFGSAELILERAILEPRHVEIQVFADAQGHTIHLGERDCSVQRRHQKILEESPCPVMTPELRERMGEAAVKAAQAVNYCGAGTVEFLLDAQQNFYFLEMNTRLQVEHPVTEMVTGLDLVEWQIRIAQGEALPCSQADITLSGHAIEARLYCEDPADGFLPATGHIVQWQPASGAGIRIDAGIQTGQDISPFYDPMVAKIIAHGPSREIARQRLVQALQSSKIFGPKTNKAFLIEALQQPAFIQGAATTGFIAEHMQLALQPHTPPASVNILAAVCLQQLQSQAMFESSLSQAPALLNWSSGSPIAQSYQFQADANSLVQVQGLSSKSFRVSSQDKTHEVELLAPLSDGSAKFRLDGETIAIGYHSTAYNSLWLSHAGIEYHLHNQLGDTDSLNEQAGDGSVHSPMHGVVLDVLVQVGDTVSKGQDLLVLEAMKMQHQLTSNIAGQVTEVRVRSGQQVASDEVLITLEPEAD